MNSTNKETKSSKNISTEKLSTFCFLAMEEFLMKKNMTDTLEAFRNEWTERPDEV